MVHGSVKMLQGDKNVMSTFSTQRRGAGATDEWSSWAESHSPVRVRTSLLNLNVTAVLLYFFRILHVKDPKLSVNFRTRFNPILISNGAILKDNLL